MSAERSTSAGEKIVAYVHPDLIELAPLFLGDCRGLLLRIEEALRSSDFESIRRMAHDLRGTAGAYGFETLTGIGVALDHAAKTGDGESVERCLQEMQTYMETVEIVSR